MAEKTDWTLSIKGTIEASKKAPKTSVALHKKAKQLALKYYGTEDLKALSPYQLDKVVGWTTGRNIDTKSDSNKKWREKNRKKKAKQANDKISQARAKIQALRKNKTQG
jgi:hypothetical protein